MVEDNEKEMTVEEAKEWWERQQSKGYFTALAFHFSQPQLIEKFNLDKNSYVLEIGAGYGRETSQFCKISNHVYAIDIAKSALPLIKQHAKTAIVSEFDGYNLEFPDKMFDLLYNCFVIQHMSKDSAKELLKEGMRVLKDDGHILFEFFDCEHYNFGEGKNYYSGGDDGKIFNNGYTTDEIKKLINDMGLKIHWIHSINYGVLPSEKFETSNHYVCIKK